MSSRHRVRAAFVVALTAAGLMAGPAASATPGTRGRRTAGQAPGRQPMMRPSPGFEPNWAQEGFANHTVRQVVRVSAGGALARVRLSNAFGTQPLTVTGATVGRSAGGAAVRPGSVRHLTFRGARSVTVRPGHELASDPAPLRVAPLDTLTVTLYLAKPTGPATYHMSANATTYRAGGDHRADVGAGAFTETTALLVLPRRGRRARRDAAPGRGGGLRRLDHRRRGVHSGRQQPLPRRAGRAFSWRRARRAAC